MSVLPDNLVSLILAEISEPEANALRLVAIRLSAQGEAVTNRKLPQISGVPLLPTPDTRAIEILWETTIGYVVLNESYAIFREDLPKATQNLEVVQDPVFDDFIARQTFATQEFPGPFQTWRFHSENNLVLVASASEPAVREIDAEPRWLEKRGPEIFIRSSG